MRIVVTGTRGIPNILGGVETHCQELYPSIVDLGCEVILIRRSCYVTADNQIEKYKNVLLKDIYAPKKKSLEAIVHTFLAVIEAKKLKADVLHIHAIGPALLTPFARLLGLKVVVTHHGPDYDRRKWGKLAKLLLKAGEYLGVKYANEIIVISSVINDIVRKKYNRTDAHLIFNGVLAPVKILSTDYIENLGLQKQQYILAMGRFVPEKGFDLLINAFAKMDNPNYQLVIAGDADHETSYSIQLKKEAQKLGIVLTGFITGAKLQELVTHTALFVLPSYHEGLPIALLEAMSYNLDVLVSDIPANRTIELSPECYFHAGNVQDLTEHLSKAIKKTVQPVSYDMRKYNWKEIAQQVMEVYHILCPPT
jgi:glycosyltransferase involved in cell wall biosynthesis